VRKTSPRIAFGKRLRELRLDLFPPGRERMTEVRITEDSEVGNPVFRLVSPFVIGHTRTMDQYLRALGNATGLKNVDITN
jgi:hypothetical protein